MNFLQMCQIYFLLLAYTVFIHYWGFRIGVNSTVNKVTKLLEEAIEEITANAKTSRYDCDSLCDNLKRLRGLELHRKIKYRDNDKDEP